MKLKSWSTGLRAPLAAYYWKQKMVTQLAPRKENSNASAQLTSIRIRCREKASEHQGLSMPSPVPNYAIQHTTPRQQHVVCHKSHDARCKNLCAELPITHWHGETTPLLYLDSASWPSRSIHDSRSFLSQFLQGTTFFNQPSLSSLTIMSATPNPQRASIDPNASQRASTYGSLLQGGSRRLVGHFDYLALLTL